MCKTFTGNSQKLWATHLFTKDDPCFMQRQQALCCKHYMFMYLDENLTKTRPSVKTIWAQKYPHPLNPKKLEIICNIFQNYLFYWVHKFKHKNTVAKYT